MPPTVNIGDMVDFHPDEPRARAHGIGPHPAKVVAIVNEDQVDLDVTYRNGNAETVRFVHHGRPGQICWMETPEPKEPEPKEPEPKNPPKRPKRPKDVGKNNAD